MVHRAAGSWMGGSGMLGGTQRVGNGLSEVDAAACQAPTLAEPGAFDGGGV